MYQTQKLACRPNHETVTIGDTQVHEQDRIQVSEEPVAQTYL